MTRRFSEAQLSDIKSRNPCDEVAGKLVSLRRKGKGFIGPCPLHSADKAARDSTSFECDSEGWLCAVCCEGGDVLKLVQLVHHVEFIGAVEILGGTREIDPAEAERRERENELKRQERERASQGFRERERKTCWEMWLRGVDLPGTTAEAYLKYRCLDLPPAARLRCIEDMPYYADGTRGSEIVHRGPAMLAAIIGPDGRFAGVHATYLDLETPSGKVSIPDMPSKKVRGTKTAGRIELSRCESPTRLIIGEGIETVLSVYTAMSRLDRDVSSTLFWSGIDLGNLGGRAHETLPHPSLKSAAGRVQRAPGPRPDLASPGIPIPDGVTDVLILGDGDSDPFLTRCALARAAARFAKEGRSVRVAFAPDGQDFNDLLRVAA